LIVDGNDGCAHYVQLSSRSDPSRYPLNAQVQIHGVPLRLGKTRTDIVVRRIPVRSIGIGYGGGSLE
jgi:hypothetical protein